MLCVFLVEETKQLLQLKKYNINSDPSVNQSLGDIEGKLGKLGLIPTPKNNQFDRVLLAGLGKKDEITRDTIRFVTGKIAQKERDLKLKEFSIIVPPTSINEPDSAVSQIVEGAKMSLYKFDTFKKEKATESPKLIIIIPDSEGIKKTARTAEIIAE